MSPTAPACIRPVQDVPRTRGDEPYHVERIVRP